MIALVWLGCTVGAVPSTEIATGDLWVSVSHTHLDEAYEVVIDVTPRVDANVEPAPDDVPMLIGRTTAQTPRLAPSGWTFTARLPDQDAPWTLEWRRPGDADVVAPLELPLPIDELVITSTDDAYELRWSPVDTHPLVLTVDTDCGVFRRELGLDVGAYDLSFAELGSPSCEGLATLERIQSYDTSGAVTVSGSTFAERTVP